MRLKLDSSIRAETDRCVEHTVIATDATSVFHMWQWTRQCAMGGAVAGLDGFEKQFHISMIVGQSTWQSAQGDFGNGGCPSNKKDIIQTTRCLVTKNS